MLTKTIGGHISPKSVDASDTGLVFAQNMMYTHTVTVYDSAGDLVKTIPDTVDMSLFGYPGHPGITHGAPVEAAFTPDSRYVYVSNYSMYGVGMGPEGNDGCTPASARGGRRHEQLRLPDRHQDAPDRPGDRGRPRAEVPGGDT